MIPFKIEKMKCEIKFHVRIDYSRDIMIATVSPTSSIIKTLRINSEINMGISNDSDLPKGLNTGAAIYQADAEEKIKIPLINTSNEEITAIIPSPKLEPITTILQGQVHTTHVDRMALLKSILQPDHLDEDKNKYVI